MQHSLRRYWALAAVAAGAVGLFLSLALGGAFGTPAATGAAPAVTPTSTVPAVPASEIFGCRASLARATLAGTPLVEPAVANHPTTPCLDATKAVSSIDLVGPSSPIPSLGTVGPAGETTYQTGSLGGQTAPAATAISNVNALKLTLPGGLTITAAGPLQSQAAVFCEGTATRTAGTSNAGVLSVSAPGMGTQTLDLGTVLDQAAPLTGPLAALVKITANERTPDVNALTETILHVQVATDKLDLVIGESKVTYAADSCGANVPPAARTVTSTITTPGTVTTVPGTTTTVTGTNGTVTTVTQPAQTVTRPGTTTTVTRTTPGGSTTIIQPSGSVPTVLQQCSSGSTYDPVTGNCVIYDNGQTIFVSKPFQGPQGGTVISLSAARRKYHSPCLQGSGPGWVLIVTRYGVHAVGTPGPDRILGFAGRQRLAGLSGNDCIDAMGTRAVVLDGNGNDRDYVTSGINRVVVGNGRDWVYGRRAGGWITTGTGTDHVYGGSAGMRIDVYGNHKFVVAGRGPNRIWSNSAVAQIVCGGNPRTVLYARRGPAAWSALHGSCARIVHIR